MIERFKIGSTKYSGGGYVEFGQYASGERAITIVNDNNELEMKATVSVVPHGADDPGVFGVWIKNYSENEGVAEALADAGVIKLTGRKLKIGYAEALHAELTSKAISALVAQR